MKPGYLYNRIFHGIARLAFPRADTVFETPVGDEPAMFVCNHSAIRGPVMMTLHFPIRHKAWVVNCAVDKTKTPNYAFHDVLIGESRRFKGFYRFLSRVITLMLPPLLKYENVIPVYHDGRIVKTYKQSIEALSGGESIVIFAEAPERYTEYVNRLQPGFVDTARLYYRRTGRRLRFYPVYAEKKNAVISVGKPIVFDPEIPMEEQRLLIADYLSKNIDRLARSLPAHRPVPFMEQRWYDTYGERYEFDATGYWRMIEEDR